jgi:hypothetical protein
MHFFDGANCTGTRLDARFGWVETMPSGWAARASSLRLGLRVQVVLFASPGCTVFLFCFFPGGLAGAVFFLFLRGGLQGAGRSPEASSDTNEEEQPHHPHVPKKKTHASPVCRQW